MANVINIGGGAGGSSGGHTILDNDGTSLTQRAELQFKGAYTEDNSTDEVTEVNVVRSMTKAEFDLLTNDEKVGIINVTDEGGSADRNYSETEILSAPVQVGASSITLTDNISNYDLLVFEVGVFADNINQTFTSVVLVSNIVNNPNDKYFVSGSASANNSLYTVYFGIKYSSETVLTIIDSNRTGWSEAGQIISIKGIKYGNGTQTFHNYSTAEHIVGTWIDGKTVYEKTISFATPSSDAYASQPLGLLTADIDNIWIAEGYAIGANTIANVAGYTGQVSNEEFMGFIYEGGSNITFDYRTGSSVQNGNAYITIRYTKSTT